MAAFTCFVLTSQRVVRDGTHDMDLTPFGAFAAVCPCLPAYRKALTRSCYRQFVDSL